jgi:hypothetical protein
MPDKSDKQPETKDKQPKEQQAAQTPPAAAPAAAKPNAVLKFHGGPGGDGRFIRGLPQRDLLAADLANLTPGQFRDATAPGPTGTPLYTVADKAAVAERFGGDTE